MTSSDVRDVLNLGDGVSGLRPSKKQKIAAPRPNLKGLAREVHNLGGDNPIAIVPEVTHFKKRRFASRKPAARWEMRSFKNSARSDSDFTLRHWRRKDEKQDGSDVSPEQTSQGEQPQLSRDGTEDSAFAKYNVQVSVPQYSEGQYQQSLQHNDWTKEETDYLLELARDFDLRWPLIWDRYEWNPPATNGEADADGDESKAIVPATRPRSLEDLKARYYEVASKMMAAQKPVQYMTQPEFSLHELMAHFNPQQEKLRKEFALNALTRSREEAREEESLLLEIKRILARSERFNEERRELYNRLDYPRADTDINAFKSSAGLQNLLQNLMTADKSKKRKSLMPGDGTSPSGTAPPQTAAAASTAATAAAAAQEAGRRESTAASTGPRDSTGPAATPTASNNKKGQPQQQQERRKLSTQEELLYGVTHHDRLGSGPTFRTERINKLFSHKSNQQQNRITNVLNELDVPNKLAMPTAATTHQYEQLLAAVNSLLDARKVSDKLDAEIKVEQAKKAEREKAMAPPESDSTVEKDKADQDTGTGNNSEAGAATGATTGKADGDATSAPGDANKDASEIAAPTIEASDASSKETGLLNEVDKNGRPGSSGAAHKRSASVLSSVSDKSNKRQKK
ncbi:SWR1-complex protein 4 [Fusarium oxysporum f. sp. lycopersici MN25]|nr:SWR1-complex protein 4 [Fusarium oxysporum f. sp. lycopersici MN25]EWZ89777.1 SWR1-complex protein 4 [Fusarium oxysporum f. sp. lycopersici MN25]EWZ89778.1 SWR1-complex protein 4 [Fusarium oxysporum f. sp. lycopersici MN25]EWZ89779.1 SWR1-complex protein 4 [Fusarium oxysporum f. sp. lycopersici MN25]